MPRTTNRNPTIQSLNIPAPPNMVYKLASPAQSTTSLSDDADEDINHSAFFASPEPAPAQWSRLRILPNATNRSPTHSPASRLPPELLIHILRHLHHPRDIHHSLLVSRAWCSCSVELLWHKPTLPSFSTLVKILRVIGREPHEQSFTYAQFIRRFNFLSLGHDITDQIFARLGQCTRLERLTLVNCNALSDDVLSRTVPAFTQLVAIDLSGVTDVSDLTVKAIAQNCHKLQGINLLGCRKLTSESVVALAEGCPMLRRVKLSGVDQLTNEPVTAFAQKTPLLLEIDLHNCKHITDAAVRDLWVHSHHMREMRLSQCIELTDSAFPAPPMSREAPPMEHVFPTLKTMDDFPPLRLKRPYEHLRMLDLTNCANVTDDAIEGIISVSPRIRNLMLAKCNALTDRSVESICKLGKHLHYLHLGHATSITDASVKELARSCQRLRYIDLANCFQLTDMSVFELAALQKLRRIGLVRVNNLTDEAIYALGDRHATLERVHLSYCDQISVMAIHFLLQKLQKLNHLSLTGIPAFRRPELQQFCREPPSEFNSTQRQAFCVYSGDGVEKLRRYLMELFQSITEEINAHATECEDQTAEEEDAYGTTFDMEVDDRDETMDFDGSPDADVEIVEDFEPARRATRSTTRAAAAGPSSSRPNRHSDHLANWAAANAAAIAASLDGGSRRTVSPHNNGLNARAISSSWEPGVALSLPPQHPASSVPNSTSSSVSPPPRPAARWTPLWTRPLFSASAPSNHVASIPPTHNAPSSHPQAHAYPQQQQPASPSLSDGSGSAAGFFRTFGEGGAPRGGGTITPDLVFAEIGHGRGGGAGGGSEWRPASRLGLATPPTLGPGQGFTFVDPASLTDDAQGAVPMARTAAHGPRARNGARVNGGGSAAGREVREVNGNGAGREVQEGAGMGPPNGAVDARGRSMKRSFRTTLSAVEQHASSFFFGAGRPPHDEDEPAAGPSTSSSTVGAR